MSPVFFKSNTVPVVALISFANIFNSVIRQLSNIAKKLVESTDDKAPWNVQFIVSTHSSHVANEAGFETIRYFLAEAVEGAKPGVRRTKIKDLRKGLTTISTADNVHRDKGTVGDVVNYLRKTGKPYLPDSIQERERELDAFDKTAGEKKSSALEEIERFKAVPYSEVKSLHKYLVGYSPFETKHGVKGAEFENVLVVIGRGWNQYNFNEMLELSAVATVPAKRASAYERNRNLFYVACSRPKKRLALLFTQQLSSQAMQTLAAWFGPDSVEALAL